MLPSLNLSNLGKSGASAFDGRRNTTKPYMTHHGRFGTERRAKVGGGVIIMIRTEVAMNRNVGKSADGTTPCQRARSEPRRWLRFSYGSADCVSSVRIVKSQGVRERVAEAAQLADHDQGAGDIFVIGTEAAAANPLRFCSAYVGFSY